MIIAWNTFVSWGLVESRAISHGTNYIHRQTPIDIHAQTHTLDHSSGELSSDRIW